MNESQEVELKLELAPDDVERFQALPSLGPPRAVAEQVSTYYDTAEGHVRKAGYSLRVRSTGDRFLQTLKEKGGGSGGFSARAEWEQYVAGPGLDLAALEDTPIAKTVNAKRVKGRLAVVSETRVQRTVWLIGGAGEAIELILDVGEILCGERREPVCEIELELKRGGRRALFDLALELGAKVPLRLGTLSKSERGFALAARRKPRIRTAERVRLGSGASVADAFAAIVQSCLRHFRGNEAGAAAGDPEALHQLRVAMRRLRSAFASFKPIVGGADHDRFRREVRKLLKLLGQARDLDVLLERAGKKHSEARQLKTDRAAAYQKVIGVLRSERLPRLLLEIVAWAEAGGWRDSSRAARGIDAFAQDRLDRLWREVRKGGKDLAALKPEARHRLRIRTKTLRYAAEFFADLAQGARRDRWRNFLAMLEGLQETLGDLNDLETAHRLGTDAPPSATSRSLLKAAQQYHDALREAGPYWR